MPASRLSSWLLVAAVTLLAAPTCALDEATYPWQAPTDTDVRAPCPALNSLANHGILPRDGKNIDLAKLAEATYIGFSLSNAAAVTVGTTALKSSKTGNASTFDLDNLDQHMPQVIEHDGSMSRNDSYWGDNHSFNSQAWDRTLATWADNDTITNAVAAAELNARFAYGLATNPEFNATFATSGALLEYALILAVTGDVTNGNGNKTLINYIFENERLPLALGWQPPTEEITIAAASALSANIAALM